MKNVKKLIAAGIFSSIVIGATSIVYAGGFSSTYCFGNCLRTREFDVTSRYVTANLKSTSNANVDGRTTMYTSLYEKKWYGGSKVGATKSNWSTNNASHTWNNVNNGKYYLFLNNQNTVWSKGYITVYC